MAPVAEAVTVSLEDLKNNTVPLATLQEAFGPDSLGILVVKDVPEAYAALRRRVLSNASYLGNLPPEALARLEHEESKYLTGWSCGKETLRSSGQPDTLKGSYYANCAFYVGDGTLECSQPTATYPSPAAFPEYLSPNVWPEAHGLLQEARFREELKALCRLMIDVAVLVARACDRFAEQAIQDYPAGYLEGVVATSMTTKARLLHYYPSGEDASGSGEVSGGDNDDWCATHLDHGCLTALTSAMFVDEAAQVVDPTATQSGSGSLPTLEELPASPDPAAGLYIHSRTGETVQVKIPRDCLAFQTGETLERITAGQFKAVPHFVRGAGGKKASRIARNTLAVFTQPNLDDVIDHQQKLTFGEFARGVITKNTV